MNTTQALQTFIIKTLDPQGYPVDAGLDVARETVRLQGSGIGLHSDFDVVV